MATRTWGGQTDSFGNANDWSGGAVPVAGDTAVINSGTVNVTGALPDPLNITMDGTNGPTLAFASGSVQAGTILQANDGDNISTLAFTGSSSNAGGLRFSGNPDGNGFISIGDAPGGAASSLVNTGGIIFAGQTGILENTGNNTANDIVNNGTISIRSAGTTGLYTYANVAIDGTGTIRIAPNANLELGREVSSGQLIDFEAGSGSSTLVLTDAGEFHGTLENFGSSDQLVVDTPRAYDGTTYSVSNGIGTLTFTAGGTPIASINFAGAPPQSNSTVTQNNGSQATITFNSPNQPSRFSFTDTVSDVSGNEAGTVYSGPVANLQYQYLWKSPDSVAISTSVSNVFVKGNAGGDALQVSGGTNVLDGGGGSNYLTGTAPGSGGQDTFYVDGRGGVVTWSTIVNFHLGDQATIFGFKGGTSTMPLTASDGAANAKGVTIHSELNGPGTGVNASLTLAGLTVDDFNTHMSVTAGSLNPGTSQEIPYLLIQYNH